MRSTRRWTGVSSLADVEVSPESPPTSTSTPYLAGTVNGLVVPAAVIAVAVAATTGTLVERVAIVRCACVGDDELIADLARRTATNGAIDSTVLIESRGAASPNKMSRSATR